MLFENVQHVLAYIRSIRALYTF